MLSVKLFDTGICVITKFLPSGIFISINGTEHAELVDTVITGWTGAT